MTPATAGPDHAVGLLERALGYTRGVLAELDDAAPPSTLPTPCRGWDLGRLLTHMEDALDAFAEGAVGSVARAPHARLQGRTDVLRHKACALLGAWSNPHPASVSIGDRAMPPAVVACAAALEIAVHGWDVGQAIGSGSRLPEGFAAELLPVAEVVVGPADRGRLFGPPLDVPWAAGAEEHLLGFLGRSDRRVSTGGTTGRDRRTHPGT